MVTNFVTGRQQLSNICAIYAGRSQLLSQWWICWYVVLHVVSILSLSPSILFCSTVTQTMIMNTAGMLGWTVAMPFDVPKTNVQARYDTKIVGSYLPELFKIARERGVVGLYGGLGPTLLRAFPANAALFLGVETGKKFFDNLVWKQ